MIGLDLSLATVLGVGAGALIILVGAFVLAVKPNDGLHRLFFLLTLMDGMSTILFDLSYAAADPHLATYLHAVYWWFFIAFVGLLIIFGLVFPRPLGGRRWATLTSAAVAVLAVVALGVYAADHGRFFQAVLRSGVAFGNAPAGNLVAATFAAATALIILKLTLDLRVEPSESHRRQATYVLGGMALAYVPFSSVFAFRALLTDPVGRFVTGSPDVILTYWTFVATIVVVAVSVWVLARDRRPERWDEHRFVLACYGAILVLTALLLTSPGPGLASALQALALLAYPILLGYAIARYNVFDIDARARRATTLSMTLGTLGLAFVVVQELAEGILVDTVLAGVPVPWLGGLLGAAVVALGSSPVVTLARRVASRMIPELSDDELEARKLEIYRHSVEGAMLDGVVDVEENRTLAVLRDQLGIGERHHRSILEDARQRLG